MKRFNLMLIFLFLIFPVISCSASDWNINAKGGIYFPIDDEFQTGKYLQAELQWKNLYLFGQWITDMERRIAGQKAGMLDIWGIGVGIKFPVNQYVKIYGQAGYYIPKSEMAGDGKFRESQWLYWRNWGESFNYGTGNYDASYQYKVQSAPGAAVGLDAQYPLSKHLIAGLNFAYQYLRFQEQFWARNPVWGTIPTGGYIETRQEKDFGGFNLGINLTWRF